jgi:hypothetical protein
MTDASLQSATLRELAHALLDKLLDESTSRELRSRANIRMEDVVDPPTPTALAAPSAKSRITLEPPAKKPSRAKPAPLTKDKASVRKGRPPRGDVLVGCGFRAKRPTVILRFSEAVAERLGLGPGPTCECGVEQVGKTLVVRPGRGLIARKPAIARQFLLRLATAERWGPLGLHPSDVCDWHFDSEDRLVIQAPTWLKQIAVSVLPPQMRSKKKNGGTQDPSMSCKKMAGTNPAVKCHACKKAPATVECNRCPTLLCDGCWADHVRVHWHAKAGAKATAAARDAHHAMRGEA